MKNIKRILGIMTTVSMILGMSISAFAGQWKEDNIGWWYQNNDNSYPRSSWQQVDSKWYHFNGNGYMQTGWVQEGDKWYFLNSDGSMAASTWVQSNEKWYYMTDNGAMLTNGITPDGYSVNGAGEWGSGNQLSSNRSIERLTGLINTIYDSILMKNRNFYSSMSVNVQAEELDSDIRAAALYWYQYHCETIDNRISEGRDAFGYWYNEAELSDLECIMEEIIGECREEDIIEFVNNYVTKKTNSGICRMNSGGDFGDAGSVYLAGKSYEIIGNRIKISGDVMEFSFVVEYYRPVKRFTAYFITNTNSKLAGYQFESLRVE